jgi:hypothetical protein
MTVFDTYGTQIMWFSLLANIFVFVILFISGIGKRVIKRWRQRVLHKRGGYVNTFMVYKNGTANEIFKKAEKDHSLVVDGDKYTVDRSKMILFDGIPTQLHFQGYTEPVDWRDPTESMSTGELQQIIENNKKDDIFAILKQYFPIVLVAVVVFVIMVGASLYFNWHIYDKLVQDAGQAAAAITPR